MADAPRRPPAPKAFADDEESSSPKSRPKPQRFANSNYGRYRRSKKHEDRIASALHGQRLPRSGGLPWSSYDGKGGKTAGGDIKTPDLMVEHKRTDQKSMSLKREWLEKVKDGARSALRDPAIVVTFETSGSLTPPEDWILIPLDVFKRLTGKEED